MNELYNIDTKLEELKIELNELKSLMKETLLIDNKIVEEDLFESVIVDVENISNELNNVVIPLLNNRE